ncbi:MAG: tetratricopeptide repeat protein [Candidatus Marinimicrobia bacterium]|nr:tetratricopeptide repeat protein [Candidatus Neomarinimicrobiota bacterium]
MSYRLGHLYYNVGRTPEAVEQLRLALVMQPGAAPIEQLLAATLSDLGEYGQSDSLYEILVSKDKDNALALNNYAYSIAERTVVTQQQLKYAFKMSKRSLKLKQNESAFLDTYGWVLYRQGKLRRAQKYVARSLDLNSTSATVLEHMATILQERGRDEQAKSYAARAAAIRRNQDMVTGERE